MELLMQWRTFGVRQHSLVAGMMRLRCMLQQDSIGQPLRWKTFLEKERTADHGTRGCNNKTVQQMGSMTHMDIAHYLSHELRYRVVCSSNLGRGIWYYYRPRLHRWELDKEGTHVLLMIHHLMHKYVDELRDQSDVSDATMTTASNAVPSSLLPRAPSRLPPVHRLVNSTGVVPDSVELQQEIIIHLDGISGDIRQLQSLLRALAALLHDETFSSRLDTTHEHLIPFANGVLDLQERRLRPGRPDDMLLRGPSYDWVDYDGCDVYIQEVERILTTIFPDRSVRDFFLDVGATMLRRRNRFKHFYILTGGTNGGKSLLMSLMRSAFGNLAGQMPIEALTRRGTDASTQTDYLARTAGQAFVVCNEPDGSTDLIQVDRLKQLVSDSDRLSVREMYSQQKEMTITYKLIMPCNTPPGFSTLDTATRERAQFNPAGFTPRESRRRLPCLSTFVNETEAASTMEQQFRDRRFVARRDIDNEKTEHMGRRLMFILYTRYVTRCMWRPSYTLIPPLRIQQEKTLQLQELTVFKKWLTAFLRPCSMLEHRTVSARDNRTLIRAVQTMLDAQDLWDTQHPDLAGLQWWQLPKEVRDNVHDIGSPGWVRCQSVHMFYFMSQRGGDTRMTGVCTSEPLELVHVQCPFVGADVVVEAFSRFRRQSRTSVGRAPVNRVNTATAAPNDDSSTPTEADNASSSNRSGSHYVNLSSRQRLDRGLVRGLIQEVIGQEAIEDNYIGWVLLSERASTSCNSPGSAMIDGAMEIVMRRWYGRYHCPPPHLICMKEKELRAAMGAFAGTSGVTLVETIELEENFTKHIPDEVYYYGPKDRVCPNTCRVAVYPSTSGRHNTTAGVYPRAAVLGYHVPVDQTPPSCLHEVTTDHQQKQMAIIDIANPGNNRLFSRLPL